MMNWFKEENKVVEFKDVIVKPQSSKLENVNLICSHIGLINTDLGLATRINGTTNRKQRSNFINVHNILKGGLEESRNDNYDIVLVDCPPSFNLITKNALVASDFYVIPVKLDYLSTLGLEELNRHVKELESDYNYNIENKDDAMNLQLRGVIFNMVSKQKDQLISSEKKQMKT